MDWASIFIHDTTWVFAIEILIRVVVMFTLIISFLRFTGKRGVRQLSIFELTIILSLGSIAGDPMFTEDLPIIQAVLIMSTVIVLYRVCTWAMMRFNPVENLLEGKSLYIVEDGVLVMDKVKKGKMSHDEFFAEMRQQGVEHLGQVRTGLLEADGNFSI
ncbi:MAG: YetF domain-containing protein, partial [Psychrobacter alimentarius]